MTRNSNQQDLSEMEYRFKAKDIKTGEWVEGDLIYAVVENYKSWPNLGRKKPMIVSMHIHGGMLWAGNRHFVDEGTIKLIQK